MSRTVAFTVLALVLSVPTLGLQRARKGRAMRNRPPIIQSFTASTSRIESCPFSPGGVCGPAGSRITLRVEASDPDNDELTYQYSVISGEIEGAGSMITWNLNPKIIGTQTATVEVSDPKGAKSSSTARVEVSPCGACDPPRSLLEVLCPKDVSEGDTAVFKAQITDADDGRRRTYLWRHSIGKRINEPDKSILRIQALGFPGEMITATVKVLGLDPAANSEASCRTRIVKQARQAH